MASATTNGGPKTNGALSNGDAHPTKEQSRSSHASSYAAKFKVAPHFIGGNHLGAAAPGSVKDFVTNHDGHTVITSVSFSDTASGVAQGCTNLPHRCSLQTTVLLQSKR